MINEKFIIYFSFIKYIQCIYNNYTLKKKKRQKLEQQHGEDHANETTKIKTNGKSYLLNILRSWFISKLSMNFQLIIIIYKKRF